MEISVCGLALETFLITVTKYLTKERKKEKKKQREGERGKFNGERVYFGSQLGGSQSVVVGTSLVCGTDQEAENREYYQAYQPPPLISLGP